MIDSATKIEVIFEGSQYKVFSYSCNDEPVVICFDPWMPKPSILGRPFGLEFLSRQGHNVISVKTAGNDWYQGSEITEVLSRVNKIAGSRRRISYGSSMGAYAAINFAERLDIDHVVLFAPQVSVDPKMVPWEERWLSEQKKISFHVDEVRTISGRSGFILFDPYHQNDRRHAELIMASHSRLKRIVMPFAGHQALDWFAQNGTIRKAIMSLLFNHTAFADVINFRRRGRTASVTYENNIRKHCAKVR